MICIYNSSSGSVPENAEEALASAARDFDLDIEFFDLQTEELDKVMNFVVRREEDTLITWGGDGTVAAVLTKAIGTPIHVLPLPGGTLNLLHQAVHLSEDDWEVTLKNALTHPHRDQISAGSINGEYFFVAAMFGNITKLTEVRENFRHQNIADGLSMLLRSGDMGLDCNISASLKGAETESEIQEASLIASVVPRFDKGLGFEVASMMSTSPIDLIRVAAESTLVGWRNADSVAKDRATTLDLECQTEGDMSYTLDGELRTLSGPTRVEFHRNIANVVSGRL